MLGRTVLTLLTVGTLAAAPIRPADPLHLQVDQHETLLRRLEQRLDNQDLTLETMRDALEERQQKERHDGGGQAEEIDRLRTSLKKTHQILKKQAAEVDRLRQLIKEQNRDLINLKDALTTVMDAFQGEEGTEGSQLYTVQPGDTLGGVAIKHKTTVKMIKTLNNMKGDTIYVGQKLRLPAGQ